MTIAADVGAPRKPSVLEAALLAHGEGVLAASGKELSTLRGSALAALTRLGLPGRKTEEFRFSHPGAVFDSSIRVTNKVQDATVAAPAVQGSGLDLFLVNGTPTQVDALPKGLRVVALRDASDTELSLVGSLLAEQDGFCAANTAGFVDGYVISVEAGVSIDAPLTLNLVQASEEGVTASLPRVLVVLGADSKLTLVERHSSVGEGETLSNSVIEVIVGARATLTHARWVSLGDNARSLAASAVSVGENGNYQSFSASSRGAYVRHDLQVRLRGSRATVNLDGLYYGREGQLVDQHVRVWHEAREGTTKECYRGVIEDGGRAVFDGIIYVCKGAVKTDARQENRNLLLGPKAIVNAKPHLEIDVDDVSCSHGATVGQLDENQLFYLRARGIEESIARQMLTWAFAKELVVRCPVSAIQALAESSLKGNLIDDNGIGDTQ
jgi:Fe-S cluster assembly protein SufD